jgi:hypothetical protein
MSSAAALRIQIERALERRFPAALSPRAASITETASTGIDEIDHLLEGGLPVGAISEITGPESSGRTTLALTFLAQRTREGSVCAWVDVEDTLDAESAAACGLALKQLLWIRCSNRGAQPKAAGKPRFTAEKSAPWTRLDQALRATDLLLQAGGFAAIVVDLGSMPPEQANRIPLATWFRFRQGAERSRTTLVVLGQKAYAQSSAALVVACSPLRAESAGETVLRGFTCNVSRARIASSSLAAIAAGARKPPASTWSASTAWNASRQSSRGAADVEDSQTPRPVLVETKARRA